MTSAHSRAAQRLDELIKTAEKWRLGVPAQPGVMASIPREDMWRFLVSSLQTVRVVCGQDSPHFAELDKRRSDFADGEPVALHECIGILAAAADDLSAGMLADLRDLVTAEVFGDLIEAAEHLLATGHHLPAAAIAGAVLEDGLRKLCDRRSVARPDKSKSNISTLNLNLHKAGVYSGPVHGQIDAWRQLRNDVDHHNFATPDEIDAADVKRMIEGVRDFVVKFLT